MKLVAKTFPLLLLCVLITLTASASPRKGAPSTPHGNPATPPSQARISADTLPIAYLSQERTDPSPLPFFLSRPTDAGLQGAVLGISDNNTTGRFLQQNFAIKETRLPTATDAAASLKQLIGEGYRHVLLDAPPETVKALAQLPEAANILVYDVGSSDDGLRGQDCSANLLHLLPSRTMRADALMQYLNKKRWAKIFLVVGPNEDDRKYADAVKRAAKRFGAKIITEKTWQHSFEGRQTPESEIPVFTQDGDYDVLVVADESGTFGDLLAYRTWRARPIAGTHGLIPSAWHYTHEQWGALQLQMRFRDQAKRWMTEKDYAAWLAIRAIGESATRVKSFDFDKIRTFMLGGDFALAGFKGVPLSFRPWDGQLRQPVLLTTERSLVAVAPFEGFLHQKNELDTLGYDQPETPCRKSPSEKMP